MKKEYRKIMIKSIIIICTILLASIALFNILQETCEKPTPLGVGWIAQNKNMCM